MGRPRKNPLPFDAQENGSPREIEPAFEAAEDSLPSVFDEQEEIQANAEDHGNDRRSVMQSDTINPVLPEGLKTMDSAPHDGEAIMLYRDKKDEGILGFWRKTRHMEHFKWVMSGGWADSLTRRPLDFQPLFWEEV